MAGMAASLGPTQECYDSDVMAKPSNSSIGVPVPEAVAERMKATFLGQCVGDALGLLTEFLSKKEAKKYYGKKPSSLRYDQKVPDFHRSRWESGDWTDDTDQMILILQSILYHKGEVVTADFAERMRRWRRQGFPEFGDLGGMGIGKTTSQVLDHHDLLENPHQVACEVWERGKRNLAANGGVMRTSILGLHQWNDIEKVVENALNIVKCTHYDPRCQASVVAVTTCIAQILQHTSQQAVAPKAKRRIPIDDIIKKSFDFACRVLETDDQRKELWKFMNCKDLKQLDLEEAGKIGYTYKCMGSGFWAVKQDNFEKAMIKLIMQGGDADTNGAVAGAMLACKLGLESIPVIWISDLIHWDWLLGLYDRFVRLQSEMSLPVEERTSNDDLSIANLNILADKYRHEAPERLKQLEESKKKKEAGKD